METTTKPATIDIRLARPQSLHECLVIKSLAILIMPTKINDNSMDFSEFTIFWTDLFVGCIFETCIWPRGPANKPRKMDVVSVKYHIGAPDAHIPQNSTDFRNESNVTSPGTWKRIQNNKNIGRASPL